MLLLDTNVISEVRKSSCNPDVLAWMAAQAVDTMYISAITVLEIQRGISRAEQRGDALQAGVFSRWLEARYFRHSLGASCQSSTSLRSGRRSSRGPTQRTIVIPSLPRLVSFMELRWLRGTSSVLRRPGRN